MQIRPPLESLPAAPKAAEHEATGRVRQLPIALKNARLLALAGDGSAEAARLLYDRFGTVVHRLIWKILGPDSEHDDVVQQTFEAIIKGVSKLRDAERLEAWVSSVAVFTARREIRKRRILRFFTSRDSSQLDPSYIDDHEARELVQRTYAILDAFPSLERSLFVLRFVERYSIDEVAELTGCSRATVHRRLAKAEQRFRKLAARDPGLCERLDSSVRRGP